MKFGTFIGKSGLGMILNGILGAKVVGVTSALHSEEIGGGIKIQIKGGGHE